MPKIQSKEDAFCVESTMMHKQVVKEVLYRIIDELKARAENHDNSKLEDPEFVIFSLWTPKLAELVYGSKEYDAALKELKPALEHHYANNRHHPEHFKNGIMDMNLIDLIEMFVDWHCASKRMSGGNIRKSIEINKTRFGFSDELESIFNNSVELVDK